MPLAQLVSPMAIWTLPYGFDAPRAGDSRFNPNSCKGRRKYADRFNAEFLGLVVEPQHRSNVQVARSEQFKRMVVFFMRVVEELCVLQLDDYVRLAREA
jgi:hypothetical protein